MILIEQVSCGNGYHAPSCSQCTFTENWCNGECEFDWDENKCKEKGIIIYLRIKIQQQKYRMISSEALKLYFIVAQSLVTCLKPDYAVPKRSTDYCERLPEWKVENCQRQCQDYSGTNMLGDPKPCVQFTFHNMTNEMNGIEYECCLYTTLTSTLEYKNGAISGPMRCGTLFKFNLILQFICI